VRRFYISLQDYHNRHSSMVFTIQKILWFLW